MKPFPDGTLGLYRSLVAFQHLDSPFFRDSQEVFIRVGLCMEVGIVRGFVNIVQNTSQRA